MDQLRESPSFEALPPVDAVVLAGPASHRYVRQDDPLWGVLHDGVLTTSRVRGALGLYERGAAKKMGIPSSRAGHGELLHVYNHLRHSMASGMHHPTAVDRSVEAAAAAHNAAAVQTYNAIQVAAEATATNAAVAARNGGGSAAAAEAATDSRPQDVAQTQAGLAAVSAASAAQPAGKSKHARRRLRKKQEKAAAASAAAGLGGAAAPPAWAVGGFSEEHKQRKARALSSLGLMSVCCSWGSAQEAASLCQVAAAFPSSQLAEVGLCRLLPELLPPAWGFRPGSLPPIGASPDALIRHCLTPAPPPPPCATGLAAGASAAAGAVCTEALEAHGTGGQAAAQAAAQTTAGGQAAQGQASSVASWDVDGLLARLQLAGTQDAAGNGRSAAGMANGSTASGGGGGSSSGSGSSSVASYLLEVVEVKNTCPFGHSRRGGKLRTSEFAIADKGPRQAIPLEWVPQLQLHMLCAGTPSGLLISRSATKGSRIFRMRRDDELLRLMLLVISRLWQEHVLPGRPPPPDVFASWHVHHDMLRRIGEAARGAQLVAELAEGEHVPDGDPRWFLD